MGDQDIETTSEKIEPELSEREQQLQHQLEEERAGRQKDRGRLDRLETLLIQRGLTSDDAEQQVGKAVKVATREAEQEPDWDSMSTKDVATFVLKRVEQIVNEKSTQSQAEIERLRVDQQTKALGDEIVEVMKSHPDLVDYQTEVTKLLTDNVKLSVEDAYYLAVRKAGKTPSEGDKGEQQTRSSLPPGGRGTTTRKASEVIPKTYEEAGAAAWKKLGLGSSLG